MTEASLYLVQQFQEIQDIKKATGSAYFPSIADADSRLAQAFAVIQQEFDYAELEIKAEINRS